MSFLKESWFGGLFSTVGVPLTGIS